MRNRFTRRRKGIAAVEFGIYLPIVVLLVFGTIEASNAIFLKQALTAAAFEAVNVAATDGGTSSAGSTRANAVLTALNVKSATVTISPTVTATGTTTNTIITVTCSAPLSANSLLFMNVLGANYSVSAVVKMPRL